MRVDIQSLGTFNQLAHEGAQEATGSLSQLTGIEAAVDVTKITLMSRADVGEELADGEFVGVQFDFDGALNGETVLVFESGSVGTLVDAMVPGDADGEMARSGVKEVGNIMMSGFIDGWADYLEATIDHSPPEYIERTGADVLPEANDEERQDQVFIFKSSIERVGVRSNSGRRGSEGERSESSGESVNFYIYMLPEFDPLADLMTERGDPERDAIPVDKLEVFNQMTTQGTEKAAENVEMMTGIATTAEVTQISFAAIEDVPKQVGNETYVGTVVEFTGTPSGYLLVLFDEVSARNVAEALMPADSDGQELTEAHKAAIEELGNIMTSGFVDGWANVLQTSVEHTPPRLVHDMGQAIVDPLAAQVGQHQEHAFIIESTMKTEEIEFESEIHALPNEAELREALDALDVDRADETEADPDRLFK